MRIKFKNHSTESQNLVNFAVDYGNFMLMFLRLHDTSFFILFFVQNVLKILAKNEVIDLSDNIDQES